VTRGHSRPRPKDASLFCHRRSNLLLRQCFLPRGGVIPFSPSLSLSLLLSLSPPLSTSLPQRQSTIRRFLRLWFLSFSRVRVPGPCVCLDHFFSLDGGSWKSRNFPEQRLHTSSRSFFTFYNSFPLFFISHLPPLLSPPSPVPPLSSLFHRGSSVKRSPADICNALTDRMVGVLCRHCQPCYTLTHDGRLSTLTSG